MKGKVYLVGAGPGDPGLMSLRGKSILTEADVIVCDRLVGTGILEMIPPETEIIDVGKIAGNHPVPQSEINKLLLHLAQAGQTVVRLKGGDPFLFGRGGEELEELYENNVDFEVIPGVTSSIAVPAYAGIPVTHRDFCSSVHIITGHARAGGELTIDFDSLVKLNGTLVFMMSVSTAACIEQGLLNAGMDPDTPAAVIEKGASPQQRAFTTTLSSLADTVLENHVVSPAIIIVGSVCSLSEKFNWFKQKPLFGKRIAVTQPADRNYRMVRGIRQLGAEAILYPCIETKEIRPLDVPQIEPDTGDPFDTIIFTSAEGVRSYCDWLLAQGLDMRSLAGKKIACIGSATAAALKKYGLISDFIPTEYSGAALGREMTDSGFITGNSRVLLLRTKAGSRDITDALSNGKIPFTDYPVYETHSISQAPLEDIEKIDIITFTSRSCVEGFIKSQPLKSFEGMKALCIGRQTAAAAASYGFKVFISNEATVDSMLDKLKSLTL